MPAADRLNPYTFRRIRAGLRTIAICCLAGLLVGGALGWAAHAVFAPPPATLAEAAHTYATVKNGKIGSSIELNAIAQWTAGTLATSRAAGVITSVDISPGEHVSPGTILFTVDLMPVVILQGDIPAFRTLAVGTQGSDVAQLQKFLSTTAFKADNVAGNYTKATAVAVTRWQKASGFPPPYGDIPLGEILFVKTIPQQITLDTNAVVVGRSLAGGEDLVKGLSISPTFTIQATSGQSNLTPDGTVVIITAADRKTWTAIVAGRNADSTSNNGGQILSLKASTSSTICGVDCASIPVTGTTLLDAEVVVVKSVSGLTIPTAALRTLAGGDIVGTDSRGINHKVTVTATAQGMSVIEGTGIHDGLKLRIPTNAE